MAHHRDIPDVFACIYLHGFSFERSSESNTAEKGGSTREGRRQAAGVRRQASGTKCVGLVLSKAEGSDRHDLRRHAISSGTVPLLDPSLQRNSRNTDSNPEFLARQSGYAP